MKALEALAFAAMLAALTALPIYLLWRYTA